MRSTENMIAMKKYRPKYDHAYYLKSCIRTERLGKVILKLAKVLAKYDYDAIAFQGMSGTLLAAPLALATGKTMIGVRKRVTPHSRRAVEGDRGARKYIIVDDCVSSGDTARRIIKAIEKFAPQAECLGVLEVDELRTSLTQV